MRIIAHLCPRPSPADNGQKSLIGDVLRRRGADAPLAVETVDRFQGQQADYVLLSLVRTKSVGHVRDIRRVVVALSRARLGLYVFAAAALFRGVAELAPAFARLAARPLALELLVGEAFPAARDAATPAADAAAASGGALTAVTVAGRQHLDEVNAMIAGLMRGP